MKAGTTYKGWANFETWRLNQWFTGSTNHNEAFIGALSGSMPNELLAFILETSVRKFFTERIGEAGLVRDVALQGFSRVDWLQIVACNRE